MFLLTQCDYVLVFTDNSGSTFAPDTTVKNTCRNIQLRLFFMSSKVLCNQLRIGQNSKPNLDHTIRSEKGHVIRYPLIDTPSMILSLLNHSSFIKSDLLASEQMIHVVSLFLVVIIVIVSIYNQKIIFKKNINLHIAVTHDAKFTTRPLARLLTINKPLNKFSPSFSLPTSLSWLNARVSQDSI